MEHSDGHTTRKRVRCSADDIMVSELDRAAERFRKYAQSKIHPKRSLLTLTGLFSYATKDDVNLQFLREYLCLRKTSTSIVRMTSLSKSDKILSSLKVTQKKHISLF
jgi:hypothetical protein